MSQSKTPRRRDAELRAPSRAWLARTLAELRREQLYDVRRELPAADPSRTASDNADEKPRAGVNGRFGRRGLA